MLSRLPFPYPRKLTDEWIASTAQQIESGTGYHLAITGVDDGREIVVGCIGLRLDMKPRVGNLGYWVGRRFWGHGVAAEAAGRLSRWALANLDLDRLEAHAAVDNPASAAVLRRITAPTLCITASDDSLASFWGDRYTFADYQQRMQEIPDVRHAVVQDAGHMLHHDQPAALAPLIDAFLHE